MNPFTRRILFLLFFLFTLQWFFLGGSLGCASVALNHARQARRLPPKKNSPAPAGSLPPSSP